MHVKDRIEYQGRHQVKVLISNLTSKCEYYVCDFDRKKLTLSNVVFQPRSVSIDDKEKQESSDESSQDSFLNENSNSSFLMPNIE